MRSSLLLLCLHCPAPELGAGLHLERFNCTTTEPELQAMMQNLESVDARLVMASPDEDIFPAQWGLVKDGAMDVLQCAMHGENTPGVLALGSELAAYLGASNPKNRAYIGLIPGVLKELVALVHYSVHFSHLDDVIVQEAENAAEALAILSKADAANHDYLAHTEAANDLAGMLERADGEMTPKGKMWAAAALGNLMSEFDNPKVTTFAHHVQEEMVARPNFTHTLVELTRLGCVQVNDSVEEMPATASRTNASRTFPHTYGWAVMHATEKLALHPAGRAQLKAEPDAQELYCNLTMSPDSLERMKAEAILLISAWGCDGPNNFRLARSPNARKVRRG